MCGYVERDCSPDRVKFDLVEGVTEGGDVGVPVLIEIITTQFLNPHILYQSHSSFAHVLHDGHQSAQCLRFEIGVSQEWRKSGEKNICDNPHRPANK